MDATTKVIEYVEDFVMKPAVNAPTKTPVPTIELFTPRYLPSKPFGIVLKNKTEFAVLYMENPTTIKHIDNTVNNNELIPMNALIKNAAMSTPKILGMYDIVVARSSPTFEIIFGATKKNPTIVMVCVKYSKKTVESDNPRFFRNGVSDVK